MISLEIREMLVAKIRSRGKRENRQTTAIKEGG
jgi:hypothetical protein